MSTFLLLAFGFLLGNKLPYWIGDLINYFEKRSILKDILPQEVKESKLCKGTHSWLSARTYTDKGPGTVQVCQLCGFIPTMNKMATPEAIDRIEENNKIRDLESKIYQDFVNQENGDLRKYFAKEIDGGLSFEKLIHVHNAGVTFNSRYGLYKSARAGEIEKVLNRSDA